MYIPVNLLFRCPDFSIYGKPMVYRKRKNERPVKNQIVGEWWAKKHLEKNDGQEKKKSTSFTWRKISRH